MSFYSPLRYPGGKNKIANFVKDIIISNNLCDCSYMEPFAGGASVGLSLLFSELVSNIYINDIDKSIYSFWFSVLNRTEDLCRLITDTQVTLQEWNNQKMIQKNKDSVDLLTLGFSTFFLNRTNRSGIINGGIIGGKEQSGKWKIDVRFNKEELIRRIKKIALYSNRIHVCNLDAQDFISNTENLNNSFIYFDPPYYQKGGVLYTNFFTHDKHLKLADYIHSLNTNWILTYDNAPEIVEMYKEDNKMKLYFNYTAAEKKQGAEIFVSSPDLLIPKRDYSAIKLADYN